MKINVESVKIKEMSLRKVAKSFDVPKDATSPEENILLKTLAYSCPDFLLF